MPGKSASRAVGGPVPRLLPGKPLVWGRRVSVSHQPARKQGAIPFLGVCLECFRPVILSHLVAFLLLSLSVVLFQYLFKNQRHGGDLGSTVDVALV